MKASIQLRLAQHLALTPQLQQSIRLLQLSTLELNAEVERLLQENPLLEKADEDEAATPPPEFMPVVATATSADAPGDGADQARAGEFDVLANAGADRDWGTSSGSSDDDDDNFAPIHQPHRRHNSRPRRRPYFQLAAFCLLPTAYCLVLIISD